MRYNIAKLVFGASIVSLVGCESTPEHTNTLLFGTTTKFALDVSVNPAGGTPDFTIGYKRHEGVWMPLLANAATGDSPTPASCEGTDCLFMSKETKEGMKTDTYSVLASFGATFSGGAEPTAAGETPSASAKASGGLAQFFATGIAAQNLAKAGGSRLVAVQSVDAELLKSVEEKAERAVKQEDQLRKILGDQYKKQYDIGVASAKANEENMLSILQTIAPDGVFDVEKWKVLVDKSSVNNKDELKDWDFAKIKRKLGLDVSTGGKLIDPLFDAI